MELPGHVPAVTPARVHELLREAPQELRDAFYRLWHDIFVAMPPTVPPGRTYSKLLDSDITTMLENGIIEVAPPNTVPTTRVFRHPEPEKGRARIITWTVWINDIPYTASPALNIAPPDRALLQAEGMHSAVVADLKAAFYQIEIPCESRYRFAFRHKGQLYWFTRLAMGARQSAEMCAIFLQAITFHALRSIGLENLMPRSIFHVDNVRIPATPDTGRNIVAAPRSTAKQFEATWGECEWSRTYDFLGFSYDHNEGLISIKESKKRKLVATAGQITLQWPYTIRDWLQVLGRALTYARAIGLAPTAFGPIAALQQRLSAYKDPDIPVTVGIHHRTQASMVLHTLIRVPPMAFCMA